MHLRTSELFLLGCSALLLQMACIEVDVHVMAFDDKSRVNCAYFKKHAIAVLWIPWQVHLPSAVRVLFFISSRKVNQMYVCQIVSFRHVSRPDTRGVREFLL